MSIFYLNLDLTELVKFQENLQPAALAAMQKAGEALTAETHAHIVEQVQNRLRSTREKYLDHLGFHQVTENSWVVDLMPGAFFIEEGLPANFDMIEALLNDAPKPGTAKPGHGTPLGMRKGKTKISKKDGSRYRMIPFEHSKAPTRQTPAMKSLTDTIKSELKKQKLPGLGTIESGADGKPKLGFVRELDITKRPLKTGPGPGQGKGPVGQVRQGPTGVPLLQGVRIYQHKIKDKQGKESVKKFAMTFRVVSSKHKGQGRWQHPGLEGRRFFDEAFTWALDQWENKVKPQIIDDMISRL